MNLPIDPETYKAGILKHLAILPEDARQDLLGGLAMEAALSLRVELASIISQLIAERGYDVKELLKKAEMRFIGNILSWAASKTPALDTDNKLTHVGNAMIAFFRVCEAIATNKPEAELACGDLLLESLEKLRTECRGFNPADFAPAKTDDSILPTLLAEVEAIQTKEDLEKWWLAVQPLVDGMTQEGRDAFFKAAYPKRDALCGPGPIVVE